MEDYRAGKSKNTQQRAVAFTKESRLNKRALSPIFATLVILAVVTVLFIPVFIWATGIASQNQDSWQQSGTAATERIVIEAVNLKTGNTPFTVYVRNIGITAVTINNVLISLADSTGQIRTYEKGKVGVTISPESVIQGDLITITIADTGFTRTAATTYDVKVFTTRGASDTYQAVS